MGSRCTHKMVEFGRLPNKYGLPGWVFAENPLTVESGSSWLQKGGVGTWIVWSVKNHPIPLGHKSNRWFLQIHSQCKWPGDLIKETELEISSVSGWTDWTNPILKTLLRGKQLAMSYFLRIYLAYSFSNKHSIFFLMDFNSLKNNEIFSCHYFIFVNDFFSNFSIIFFIIASKKIK